MKKVGAGVGIVSVVFVLGLLASSAAHLFGGGADAATQMCIDAIDKGKMDAYASGKDPNVKIKKVDGGTHLTTEGGSSGCNSVCEGTLTDKGFVGSTRHTCLGVGLSTTSIDIGY